MKVISRHSFQLHRIFICDHPRDKFTPFIANSFVKDSKVWCAVFDIPEVITDFEFLDGKELGLCIEDDEGLSSLLTVSLDTIRFKSLYGAGLFQTAKSLNDKCG
ncbi:hypothetical protein MFLAVUS_009593 [Mucor flavus]|uniref:Uncharacterized protein n=1 Tax=Mucor flavus TaxID=439312 RepID=A0ABP9ZAB2_9FUNG